jgi:hypothetical protein
MSRFLICDRIIRKRFEIPENNEHSDLGRWEARLGG